MHKPVCQVDTSVPQAIQLASSLLIIYKSELQSWESSKFCLEEEIMGAAIL